MSKPSRKSEVAFARPDTLFGTACCLFVCATIAYIAWLVIAPRFTPARRLWMPVVIETNGDQTVLGETRQLEFWTPSAKTKDYLVKEGGKFGDKEKWQVLPNDAAVLQFGMVLHSNQNLLGYRRVEVWGQGRTNFKPGWWWTVNAFTNYSVVDLAHTYQTFWKAPQPVFIEVIDNRGSD
jgi:hypothetical protein